MKVSAEPTVLNLDPVVTGIGLVAAPLGTVVLQVFADFHVIEDNAREVDAKSAMPVTGISKRGARDMAAYLLARR